MCSRPSSAGSTVRSNPRRASRRGCRLAEVSTGRRRIRPDRFEVERQRATAPTSSSPVVSGVGTFFGRELGPELASINRIRNNDRPNRLSPGARHAERELCRNNQRVYAHARVAVKRVAPGRNPRLPAVMSGPGLSWPWPAPAPSYPRTCSRPSSAGSTVRSNPPRSSQRLCRLAEVSTGRRRIRPDRFEVENQQDPARPPHRLWCQESVHLVGNWVGSWCQSTG